MKLCLLLISYPTPLSFSLWHVNVHMCIWCPQMPEEGIIPYPWSWSSQVATGNGSQVPCLSSKCSWPLSSPSQISPLLGANASWQMVLQLPRSDFSLVPSILNWAVLACPSMVGRWVIMMFLRAAFPLPQGEREKLFLCCSCISSVEILTPSVMISGAEAFRSPK